LTISSESNPAISPDSPAGAFLANQFHANVLPQAAAYVCAHKWKFIVLSAAMLIPCFWRRHIEAGDLASHTYNVWLVQLIHRGEAPGLWLTHPWTNVSFDYLLSGCIRVFGFPGGDKMAVSISLLIFIWGTFALVCAASRRVPWQLFPLLAMIAYGWTFEMGFFNYYISLGLACFGLAIFWRGHGWERWLLLLLLPLILAAHPLGAVWLAGAAIYVELAERHPGRAHTAIFLAAAAGIVFFHFYLPGHFDVSTQEDYPLYFFNGADQFVLFGRRYHLIESAVIALILMCLITAVLHRKSSPPNWTRFMIPMELYFLVELGVFLLPDGIRVKNNPAALALFTERITTISAVLICCALAALPPKKWHLAGWGVIACVFFGFIYQDTGQINRMEMQVEKLVRTIPPNQRVMATILRPRGSRVLIQHILDRACIGHCFSYGNYEPGSALFRVRARPGNPYVLTDFDLVASMEEGSYIVQPQDLPVYQVYQCSDRGTDLCIMSLEAGEENDSEGVHPGQP
jgi:hypothetical protein